MKKVFIALCTATMMLSLAACGDVSTPVESTTRTTTATTPVTSNTTEEPEQTTTTTEEVITESEPDFRYADLIPNPEDIFVDGEISIILPDNGGNSYLFQVRNYNEGEYETFVSGCKELGFTNVKYETENDGGNMFGAYTSDGEYWVEVLQGNETGIIAVTCKKSTKS